MSTVAVMQPYFMPYAGYFRLFAECDTVAMFDCVQFPRRGWVHRNRLPDARGDLAWLTLPVAKAAFDARICDLRFPADAGERIDAAMKRFPVLQQPPIRDDNLLANVRNPGVDVTEYLIRLVQIVCDRLGLRASIVRSSSLAVAPNLHGQDRVIAIAKALDATRYVNPPGGRDLYDAAAFERHGIELAFHDEYDGDTSSMLARLLSAPAGELSAEIRAQAHASR